MAWLAPLAGLVSGCATIDLPKKLDFAAAANKAEAPARMTALWTDTVLVEAGVVGFGGRVMFYGRGDEDPIRVEGELTVFAYDDTDSVREDAVPARKYVFRAEELAGHYSESKLGHSYSFWIPWDRVGGPRRQVSLIARFKSAQGGVVMSEMTRHLLPGSDPSNTPLANHNHSPKRNTSVSQATHQSPLPSSVPEIADHSNSMQTTTIPLNDALGAAAARSQAPEEQLVDSAALAYPTPPPPNGNSGSQTTPVSSAASSMEPDEIRAMVRDAVQEALAANQAEQPVDRFGRRKYRARIAPKLPPARDPAPTQLPLGARQFSSPTTPQGALPTELAPASSGALPQSQRLPAGGP